VCEGYSIRNAWQKPASSKTPVPLQSKNGYGTPGPQSNYYPEVSPEYTPGSSNPNGSENKPLYGEDERRNQASVSSPSQGRRNQNGWSREERQYQNHSAQLYHEMDRPSTAQNEATHDLSDPLALYPSTTAHPPQSHHINRTSAPTSQSAPAVAQAALQNPILNQRPSTFLAELTEREKMLRGAHHLPSNPTLMKDREQCAAAVWRFNNSTNPTTGISYEERTRFFKAILSLRPTPEPRSPGQEIRDPDLASLPVGSVGNDVTVEAPFHCDYGYNIRIGSNVTIGPDCRITDTCEVAIGNNVIFSPGVKLYCTTYAISPQARRGGKGMAVGRGIVIEDDCWIGTNVTITAGVTIGRQSTIGAGSLITVVSLLKLYTFMYGVLTGH
jgi:acetyltransferase-like isoleucine patch superfamily enzyme